MRRSIISVVALAALTVGLTGCDTANTDGTTHADDVVKQMEKEQKAEPVDDKAAAKPKPKPKPKYTVSQENAIASARDYLEYDSFSKAGLIEQLSSEYGEGFPRKDAEFAVNHITVDWNKQAVASARDYLEYDSYSKAGLIEQLESEYGEQFTHAQAVYGVSKTGL